MKLIDQIVNSMVSAISYTLDLHDNKRFIFKKVELNYKIQDALTCSPFVIDFKCLLS